MPQTLSISGLKRSPELVQINLSAGESPPILATFELLARRKINLVFVTMAAGPGGVRAACALAADSWPAAEPLLKDAAPDVAIVSPVGTLTVFPHRWRPELLGAVLNAFREAAVPVYGIASSLAALTFATDYRRLDAAVAAIRGTARLPDNHAPLDNPWRIRQL